MFALAKSQGHDKAASTPSMPYIIPVLAGALMLAASFLPWLNDPLGSVYSAWAIPLDIGWHMPALPSPLISYGLLCGGCAMASFLVAYHRWRQSRTGAIDLPPEARARQEDPKQEQLTRWQLLTALLCLVPLLLLLLQYLYIDIHSIDTLAQHKLQFLLIQLHMGYKLADQPIQLQPFQVDIRTIQGRMVLLTNQVAAGLLGPAICAWLLAAYLPSTRRPRPFNRETSRAEVVALLAERDSKKLAALVSAEKGENLPAVSAGTAGRLPALQGGATLLSIPGLARLRAAITNNPRRARIASAIALAVVACILLRAPLAAISESQARTQLAAGDYPSASWWLQGARLLNPMLAQLPFYHEEQGQVWYFTHPGSSNTDSHLYLASVYRAQGDYLNAYQELLEAWNSDPHASWIKDEMGLTVALMAENVPQKIKGTTLKDSDLEVAALTWLHTLEHVDNANLYSQYYMGRIQYDKHDYAACIAQMNSVLNLSRNSDIRSSAYTYIALSIRGEGDIDGARRLFLQAIALDPYYHNNTAREELSGLH